MFCGSCGGAVRAVVGSYGAEKECTTCKRRGTAVEVGDEAFLVDRARQLAVPERHVGAQVVGWRLL